MHSLNLYWHFLAHGRSFGNDQRSLACCALDGIMHYSRTPDNYFGDRGSLDLTAGLRDYSLLRFDTNAK